MADYLAMKSYLEKHNLHYFTFSPNSKKPIKAVIRHLPPDTAAEDISNSLEGEDQSKSIKTTNPRGNPPSILGYLNKKLKIARDIQAE
jgi:hypothetical protein